MSDINEVKQEESPEEQSVVDTLPEEGTGVVEPTPVVEDEVAQLEEEYDDFLNADASSDETPEEYTNPHVTLTDTPFSPLKKNQADEVPIFSHRDTADRTIPLYLANSAALKLLEAHKPNYTIAVSEGIRTGHRGKAFSKALQRDESAWGQFVEHEGRKFKIRRPKLASTPGQLLTGTNALIRVQTQNGLGGLITIPLWHSGIWLTLRTPSDVSLNLLDRLISNVKTNLGWESYGLAFSSSEAYMNAQLMDFIVEHTHTANIADFEPSMLYDIVRIYDFQTMCWGLASSIYTNGYPIAQPCFIDPNICNHVTRETVNLTKLQFVDRTALTPYQIRHMAKDTAIHSLDDIMKYQNDGALGDGKTISIKLDSLDDENVVRFVLKAPKIRESIDSGKEWISTIIHTVEKSVGSTLKSYEEKEKFLASQSDLAILRQYSSFITRIINSDDSYIEEEEDIAKALEVYSANTELTRDLLQEITDYIEDNIISVIALPAFACPACKKPLINPDSKHPHLIPLEVSQLFFTLMDRKLSRIKQ